MSVAEGLLLVGDVPFVTSERLVSRGVVAMPLAFQGERTARPTHHAALWAGGTPCDVHGDPLHHVVRNTSSQRIAPDLTATHGLCVRPNGREFLDHHEMVVTYVALLGEPALMLDANATARDPQRGGDVAFDSGPFRYLDTATSRAGTSELLKNVRGSTIGIVGLGGTGSYVLDLVAKTPVRAIHLYDADAFDQHNAFRAPGAASVADVRAGRPKVDYLAGVYSRMHRRIVAHATRIDQRTSALLDGLDFVFLCIDEGAAKPPIVDRLVARGIPFVDVGMGLTMTPRGLVGALRTTMVTAGGHKDAIARIPMIEDPEGVYASNIQVAELNALNAALAVTAWKRHTGFYAAEGPEANSVFVVESGRLFVEGPPP